MEAVNVFEHQKKEKTNPGIKNSFPVTGMTCAACASSVESILLHTEGVNRASVNFASSSVLVEYEKGLSPNQLQNALREVGYDIIIDAENPSEVQQELQQKHYQDIKSRTIWSAILTLPIFVLGMFYMQWEPGKWISLVIILISLVNILISLVNIWICLVIMLTCLVNTWSSLVNI